MKGLTKTFGVAFILLMVGLIMQVTSVSAESTISIDIAMHGTIIHRNEIRYTETFHTGARVWELVANETYDGYYMYSTWDIARPYVKYALIQGGAILTDDGDIKPVYYLNVSWNSLQKYLALAYNSNTYPIF